MVAARVARCALCGPGDRDLDPAHRHPPDLTPHIRETFEQCGFAEVAFEYSSPFGVGVNRLVASPQPFQADIRLFDFVGYDVLAHGLHIQ